MEDFYIKYGLKNPTKTLEELCLEIAKDLIPIIERDFQNPDFRKSFEKWLEIKNNSNIEQEY